MHHSTSTTLQHVPVVSTRPEFHDEIRETRLWLEEHDWPYGVLRSDDNTAPSFRFPDLISACVSLTLNDEGGPGRVFRYLRCEVVLRATHAARRRESMWRQQYEGLQSLQRSPANRHPHPMFQLDQLTTACVALARDHDSTGAAVLRQARVNTAHRQAPPSN